MSTKAPTPNHAELEKLARDLARKADTDAIAAKVLSVTPGKRSRIDLVIESGDVYQALDTAAALVPNAATRLAIVTCGWAAPTDETDTQDIAPSLHPKRQRVALVCVHDLTTGNTVSVIRFAAKRNLVADYGDAHGSLANAIANFGRETLAHRNA